MENRRFTNTALPVFSGAECWYQHIHIVQAIVKSNGWSDETAALQLFAHLKGEALNVALLLTKEKRESWTGLMCGLSAYYQSPGRLAGLRRRFESVFRQPGLDLARFATDLGILAIQGFGDIKEQARDTMIRDKFIAGQGQCALRRQLDGFAQDTPIGEIVDSCRVWESHSDSNRVSTVNYDSEFGNQPSDSRTWERRKMVDMERQEPDVGNRKDDSDPGVSADRSYQSKLEETRKRDRPPTGGPVWFSCGNDGHSVNRCPQMRAASPPFPETWWSSRDNEHYRFKNKNQKLIEGPGNEQRFEREVQPLGPLEIKAPLTQVGVSVEISNGSHWTSDSLEFPSLEAQRTAGNTKGSAGPSITEMDRRPMGHPTPVLRNLDKGMRPVKAIRSVPRGNRNARTWGVQKPIVTSLSALAENFIPRKTSKKRPTQQAPHVQ